MIDSQKSLALLTTQVYSIWKRVLHSSPSAVSSLKRGVMTFKFVARMADGQSYIIRFYPPERSYVVDFEPDLLRRCRIAGLKVPEIIADSRDDYESDRSYVIYRKLEGNALSTIDLSTPRAHRNRLFSEIIGSLDRLFDVAIEGYGELLDALHARRTSLMEFVGSSFDETIAYASDRAFFSHDVISALEYVKSEFARLSSQSSGRLVWGDLGPENILVDDRGRLTGLLDFEGAFGGAGLADIGYCYARYADSKFWKHLVQELDERLDENARLEINLYAILRGIRLLRFGGSSLPTGASRMPISELLPGFLKALRAIRFGEFAAL